MAFHRNLGLFCCVVLFAAIFALASAQERVKKQILSPYAAYPYAAYPYAAYPYAAYPYVYGADDGSYFPGKYDPYY